MDRRIPKEDRFLIRYCNLVSGCTIVSNKAFKASGLSHGGGGVAHCTTVTNCTIAYNYAKGSGGGLYQCKKVFDSTVAHNVAEEYVQYESGGAGGAYGGRFYNCTFKDNYAGSISEGAYMEGCVIEDGGIDCLCNYPKRGRPPKGARVTIRVLGINHNTNRMWGAITHIASAR